MTITARITAPRPFLKWAGGKSQLLPALLERVPAGIETYYEPFIGGGALFFALLADPERRPRRAVLNDLNLDLVTTYQVVRDAPEALIETLAPLAARYLEADTEAREAAYYEVRADRPAEPLAVAARLLFLNKTCFNGLYRVNRRGEFNVPHGRYRNPHILDAEAIRAASAALQTVEVRHGDFEAACADARRGDFVYFDPPFHPLSPTSSFTSYTEQDFGRDAQIRLKRCIDDLTARGVRVLVSNSPHPWIHGGYEFAGYRVDQVPARRSINSRGSGRGPIPELVITNPQVDALP
ncbi:MAG: DNA adenine methylase [Dehalococcoidia bacterium]